MPARTKTPEGHVKTAVLDYLAYMRDVFVLRVNSGMLLGQTFDGRRIAVHLAKKGTADIQVLVPHHDRLFSVLWVETKAPKKGLRPDQKDFRDDVEAKGHFYLVAREVEDVQKWFNEHRGK